MIQYVFNENSEKYNQIKLKSNHCMITLGLNIKQWSFAGLLLTNDSCYGCRYAFLSSQSTGQIIEERVCYWHNMADSIASCVALCTDFVYYAKRVFSLFWLVPLWYTLLSALNKWTAVFYNTFVEGIHSIKSFLPYTVLPRCNRHLFHR